MTLIAAVALTVVDLNAQNPGASSAGSATTWTSINPTFSALSLAQGIPTGSLAWTLGGMHVTASDTGGQSAYGWRHDHLLTPDWIRAVVANYGARPAYYEHAPARFTSYVVGCRPIDWLPDLEAGALPDGSQLVAGVAVSGFDLEHFALSPLIAVARSNGYSTATPGFSGGLPSNEVARAMVRSLMAAHAGMLRNANGALTPYVVSDRAARYLVGNVVAALKVGSIDMADAQTIGDYIWSRLLPHWSTPPSNDPSKGGELQVYNSVCWAMPALFDLAVIMPPGEYQQAIIVALKVQSQKLALLQSLVPGKACTVDKVATWYDLTPAGIVTESYLGPWEVRSMLIAGKMLGLPACTAEGLAEAAKWKNDPEQKTWLVLPNGEYIYPTGP